MLNVGDSAYKAVAPGLEQLEIQKGNISILTWIDPLQNIRIMIMDQMCAGCSAVWGHCCSSNAADVQHKRKSALFFLFFVENCC